MTTLGKISFEVKFLIKWGGIILISFLVIYFGIKIGNTIKERLYPTPPPAPSSAFGKLRPIQFPPNIAPKEFKYTVDTLSGKLPVFADRIKIYKLSQNTIGFLTLDRIKEFVLKIGFISSPYLLKDNIYQWTDAQNGLRKISFNILSSNFTYSTSFITDPMIQSSDYFPEKEAAVSEAKNFLELLNSFPEDIDEAKTTANYEVINDYALAPSQDEAPSQIIQVNFFQKDKDAFPIYYPKSGKSTISVIVAGKNNSPEVAEALYAHKNISEENAEYPIKTAEQALKELNEGKAYIASEGASETNTILIKNVFQAYYLDEKEENYLMPIIVFTDSSGFLAYVSAVTPQWINN